MPFPTFAKILQEAEAKLQAAKDIQAKADTEKRPVTAEEEKAIEALLAEHKTLKADGLRRRNLHEADEDTKKSLPRQSTPDAEESEGDAPRNYATPKDPKEEKQHGFRSMGEFAQKVAEAYDPRSRSLDNRLLIGASASGANQGVGGEGGFLVPPGFQVDIWDGLNKEPDNLIQYTDQYTVTGDTLTLNALAETSRATGSRAGGITAYWIAEADQITSSKPKFRQIKGEPSQLAALVYVTDKLLANAPALNQFLATKVPQEILFLANDAIINGNGVGQPFGILTAMYSTTAASNKGPTISVAKETGQAAATILFENVSKMYARIHPRSRANANWFINVEVEPQLQQMTLGIGSGGVPVYMPPGGISGAPYGTLFGRPVIPIEFCAALGTVGDIILADLSMYVTFTKGGLESAMSIHLRFDYLESVFRWVWAIDGTPWLAQPITPYKATSGNVLSPFVTLAARA